MDVHFICADGGLERHRPEDVSRLLERTDGFIWVDIPQCDDAARMVLRDDFALHPMAIQDCCERNRVPKMHAYTDHVLIVLHAPERGSRGHVHYVEPSMSSGSPPGPRSSSPHPWSARCTA